MQEQVQVQVPVGYARTKDPELSAHYFAVEKQREAAAAQAAAAAAVATAQAAAQLAAKKPKMSRRDIELDNLTRLDRGAGAKRVVLDNRRRSETRAAQANTTNPAYVQQLIAACTWPDLAQEEMGRAFVNPAVKNAMCFWPDIEGQANLSQEYRYAITADCYMMSSVIIEGITDPYSGTAGWSAEGAAKHFKRLAEEFGSSYNVNKKEFKPNVKLDADGNPLPAKERKRAPAGAPAKKRKRAPASTPAKKQKKQKEEKDANGDDDDDGKMDRKHSKPESLVPKRHAPTKDKNGDGDEDTDNEVDILGSYNQPEGEDEQVFKAKDRAIIDLTEKTREANAKIGKLNAEIAKLKEELETGKTFHVNTVTKMQSDAKIAMDELLEKLEEAEKGEISARKERTKYSDELARVLVETGKESERLKNELAKQAEDHGTVMERLKAEAQKRAEDHAKEIDRLNSALAAAVPAAAAAVVTAPVAATTAADVAVAVAAPTAPATAESDANVAAAAAADADATASDSKRSRPKRTKRPISRFVSSDY